jgi:hypothetical protein
MTEEVPTRVSATRPTFLLFVGRKHSGKSVAAHAYWNTWTRDRLVVDVTGDALKDFPDPSTTLLRELPDKWQPEYNEDDPMARRRVQSSLRYIPNPRSETYYADLDRAVGLAVDHGRRHGPTLCWIDEIGRVARANQTGPHARLALEQGRHHHLSMLMCGPRPVGIDPLALSQADRVLIFETPHPRDQARLAEELGLDPKHLGAAIRGLPEFHYLLWDAHSKRLFQLPPIPHHQRAGGRRGHAELVRDGQQLEDEAADLGDGVEAAEHVAGGELV